MLVLRCVPDGRTAFHRQWRQRSLAGILIMLHTTYLTFGILPGLRMDCRCYYNNKMIITVLITVIVIIIIIITIT